MASAAVFTHLVRTLAPHEPLSFRYRSCGYGPGMQTIPEGWLDGDENAILDFRYTKSTRLSWYFDHHVTAFGSAEEARAALASSDKAHQVFYEPTYGSCTKLIADVASARFGVESEALAPLVAWADVIDAARFPTAEAAVDREEPVLKLASVVEHHGDGPFLKDMVPRLLERPLDEVARGADITELYRPLAAARETFIKRVKQAGTRMGNVVLVDLSDAPIDAAAKFVTYALFPEAMYSVTVTRQKQHIKISVGYNPWCGKERRHDIAAICRRYDGGGHPVVGAASFPLAEITRARAVALSITRELDT
ncbi:hypothetical protein GF068_07205 [Polyangium spumosum]|uniref:Phosphoesterase n=2 Tax=Polyangium spumosum TaxID=889282 RepID=A0A6N7PI00_9BACT|nr:hypothetical protein [Polyangium spumosum]MRG91713.1 hypothetical protein [Polyangium spumosum]